MCCPNANSAHLRKICLRLYSSFKQSERLKSFYLIFSLKKKLVNSREDGKPPSCYMKGFHIPTLQL